MFITATNDKASILSGIINCIGSSNAKVTMIIASKRPIADILYITKEILYLLEDTQDCDYKILTNSNYFCVKFENGSVFEADDTEYKYQFSQREAAEWWECKCPNCGKIADKSIPTR